MAILTTARQAVWDAIDNWPALANTFRQKIRFEKSSGTKLGLIDSEEPSGQDFPCIAVSPSVVNPTWLGNQVQFRPYSLTITIWTAGWDSVNQNEQIWEDVINAIYKCKLPDDSDTYIGAATNAGPYGFGNSRWTRVTFPNKQKAWNHSFDVVLKIVSSLTV
jgi:hypothetical protein